MQQQQYAPRPEAMNAVGSICQAVSTFQAMCLRTSSMPNDSEPRLLIAIQSILSF